jgi:hypothetical protein
MGAQARLEELRNEETAIRQAFPELGPSRRRRRRAPAAVDVAAPAAKQPHVAAARRAVSNA